MAIPDEMYNRLKERIDRLGEETVLKAFLNVKKQIAKDLKRIEEEENLKKERSIKKI